MMRWSSTTQEKGRIELACLRGSQRGPQRLVIGPRVINTRHLIASGTLLYIQVIPWDPFQTNQGGRGGCWPVWSGQASSLTTEKEGSGKDASVLLFQG